MATRIYILAKELGRANFEIAEACRLLFAGRGRRLAPSSALTDEEAALLRDYFTASNSQSSSSDESLVTRTTDESCLSGCEILLGVCGGIAAYKSAELTSLLVKRGAKPTVIMTDAATKLVAPKTFEALTKRPVALSMWEQNHIHPHIELARQAEIFCVAPATANIMAKAACGLADDLMSATILAFSGKLIFAPAMNSVMWKKNATQRNYRLLLEDGVEFVGPASGRLSCGEEGVGRMSEPSVILLAIEKAVVELKSK